MVEEIQRSVNSEVESLRIRLELMDTELEISKQQTENAEEELRQLKASIRLSAKYTAIDSMTTLTTSLPPPPPPPPPPPMPLINQTTNIRSRSGSLSLSDAIAAQKLNHQSNGQQQMALSKKATGRDFPLHYIHIDTVLCLNTQTLHSTMMMLHFFLLVSDESRSQT